MSNRKFTWCQDLEGNSGSQSFNTLSSKFGDGYEQNTSIGINNRTGTWQYSRTAKKAEIMQIKAFFDQHKGADSVMTVLLQLYANLHKLQLISQLQMPKRLIPLILSLTIKLQRDN